MSKPKSVTASQERAIAFDLDDEKQCVTIRCDGILYEKLNTSKVDDLIYELQCYREEMKP